MKFAIAMSCAFFTFTAIARASTTTFDCKSVVQASVQEKAQKRDENSGVIAVRTIGNLSAKAFQNDLLAPLKGYYVTTSDETGGCVWHVIATDKCSIVSTDALHCF